MRKITINGVEIECDDNVEIAIEGSKVTIKAAPNANGSNVVHEHHYHHTTQTITSPPLQPFFGSPFYPQLGQVIISSGSGLEPPMTPGFVSSSPSDPGFLPNSNAQALSLSVQ
jgi:hypothetical protein